MSPNAEMIKAMIIRDMANDPSERSYIIEGFREAPRVIPNGELRIVVDELIFGLVPLFNRSSDHLAFVSYESDEFVELREFAYKLEEMYLI